jgi:hypothetical protein
MQMIARMKLTIGRLALLAIFATACSPPSAFEEHFRAPTRVEVPGLSYDVEWIAAENFAVTSSVEPADAEVSVVALDGTVSGVIELPRRGPDCVERTISGVARLPGGQVSFAIVCLRAVANPPRVGELFAYDPGTSHLASLGATARPPMEVSWSQDATRAIYVADGSLCSTLYEHGLGDGPLSTTVRAQGADIPLGEDLDAAPDQCTERGNAQYPAFAPTSDSFAAFARATGERHGQDRIDLPWALVLVTEDGTPSVVIDGVIEPSGLRWLTDGVLVFAGSINGTAGLWVIRQNGTGLAHIGDADLASIAVAPDGPRVVGLVRRPPEQGLFSNSVAIYDLSGVTFTDAD